MKKRSSFGLNIGLSSILVIIVILCLVCFAGLSVASANADYQLSSKLSNRASAYYDAAAKAYTDLYTAKESSSLDNSFDKSYPINDNQILHVKATLLNNYEGYEISYWEIETVKNPEIDNSLSLLLSN